MTHHTACKLSLTAFFAAAAIFGISPAFAQEAEKAIPKGDPEKGKVVVEKVCGACHGIDGQSFVSNYPHLAGQIPEYIVKQLRHFKSGERVDPLMSPMAAQEDVAKEEDELNVAAWYAAQTAKPVAIKDETQIARGQKLWRGGDMAKGIPACSGCHGPSGHGLAAQYPRLSGQYPEYIALQLNKFRTGERANDPEAVMRDIAEKLTDRDIKAVSEYAASLR
ncbi:MAG: cytochrome c4 [Zoogloeaceae bacterium]|jgi:cytochrome c553|nr:cytochrome c4 [Zoogloeaceae bacterium]